MKQKCPYCGSNEFSYWELKDIENGIIDIMQCDKCNLFFGFVYEFKKLITIPDREYALKEG